MEIQQVKIQQTDAIIIGDKKEKAILFVHGQGGNKGSCLLFWT